ncbi:MAG TPA: class I SAM-dependent methyltransferase, partial [Bacteroidia bacterium]|nr:class I SAM-dependent methyltransferase [Bacteroidia bacterium]
KGFDRLAPVYDSLARFFSGNGIERAQLHFLGLLRPAQRILVFGGGTGVLLPHLLRLNPGAQIWFVDLSGEMIRKAKKRVEQECPRQLQDIHFVEGSYTDLPESGRVDLMITPFVLDCFRDPELGRVMKALASRLASGGQWLFVDFTNPEPGYVKPFASFLHTCLYFFFNLFCHLGVRKLPLFSLAFAAVEFRLQAEKKFCGSLLTARIYER